MDVRRPFLEAAHQLVFGFAELARYRIVGNTACVAIVEVNLISPHLYEMFGHWAKSKRHHRHWL